MTAKTIKITGMKADLEKATVTIAGQNGDITDKKQPPDEPDLLSITVQVNDVKGDIKDDSPCDIVITIPESEIDGERVIERIMLYKEGGELTITPILLNDDTMKIAEKVDAAAEQIIGDMATKIAAAVIAIGDKISTAIGDKINEAVANAGGDAKKTKR
jgi:hypothetical protein